MVSRYLFKYNKIDETSYRIDVVDLFFTCIQAKTKTELDSELSKVVKRYIDRRLENNLVIPRQLTRVVDAEEGEAIDYITITIATSVSVG